MRAPSVPLITVDPYFSVWSTDEHLNYNDTVHWTGSPNTLIGTVTVDGESLVFLGKKRNLHKLPQTSLHIDALSTVAVFENSKIRLIATFLTPLLPDSLELLSRPVSYLSVRWEAVDGFSHDVTVDLTGKSNLCLDHSGDSSVSVEKICIGEDLKGIQMGNTRQKILNRSGDDLRIDWGYFYLLCKDVNAEVSGKSGKHACFSVTCKPEEGQNNLFLFAYDDINSIQYFGENLKSYWNRNGKTVETAISEAAEEFSGLLIRCKRFSDQLYSDAELSGGKKYAEMLSLSYRQVIAAHKIAMDPNGELLFISKECFSNGCAATVDVSYPSIPMFLIYNTELIKGMLRPIYRFMEEPIWTFDFAPHDVGQYPLVNGQVYGLDKKKGILLFEKQMPVEECGNMLIMETNLALADGTADFAASHLSILMQWCDYLIRYGEDPENQLCTDDFAGHLAHNCNLSLKAVMGVEGMSIIMKLLNRDSEAASYHKQAVKMAKSWCVRARNSDGSYRLAFDCPDSYSIKYNMVWDKVWGTGLFPKSVVRNEINSEFKHFNKYGMPLDSRADYTKSDWIVWMATLASNRRDFERFIAPLWKAYDESPSRVPMTDWYDTVGAYQIGFQHRSVQGGLFIKMLCDSGKLRFKK